MAGDRLPEPGDFGIVLGDLKLTQRIRLALGEASVGLGPEANDHAGLTELYGTFAERIGVSAQPIEQ